jgi:peptide/nickel transport system substrate-binding protein
MKKGIFTPQRLLLLALTLIAALVAYRIWFVKPPEPDVVRVRVEALAKTLNPYMSVAGYTQHLSNRIFQCMGYIHPTTLELQPVLIKEIPKEYTIQDGPDKGLLAYDFEILDGASWDNGSPITAKDVEFTFKTIFNPLIKPAQVFKGYLEQIKSLNIDPNNPRKFTIVFSKYYFLGLESVCSMPILPVYQYDAGNQTAKISLTALLSGNVDSTLFADPGVVSFAESFQSPRFATDISGISGSNAYKLEVYNEQEIKLVKKNNWWGDKYADRYPQLQAHPKRIEYKLVTQDPALEAMLKNNELEFADRITPAKFQEWKENTLLNTNYEFLTGWSSSYNRLLLNLTNPKLSDRLVRQALCYAVDYDYLINNVAKGLGNRMTSPVSSNRKYFNKDVPLYQLDIDKARALLTQAGWADSNGDGIVDKVLNGQRTELVLDVLTSTAVKISEAITASLEQTFKRAGIGLKVTSAAHEETINRSKQGQFEITLAGTQAQPTWIEFYQQFHSASMAPDFGDNRSRFSNPTADSLITLIRSTRDDAQRTTAYKQMQQILHDEVPEIYLYSPTQRYVISKKLNAVVSLNHPGYYETWFTNKK